MLKKFFEVGLEIPRHMSLDPILRNSGFTVKGMGSEVSTGWDPHDASHVVCGIEQVSFHPVKWSKW